MACSISKCVFLMILCCVVLRQYSSVSAGEDEAAENTVPLAKGLSWTFYQKSCPEAESIIRNQLKKIFKKDIGQAAGLLRLHFHDCFVQVLYISFISRPIWSMRIITRQHVYVYTEVLINLNILERDYRSIASWAKLFLFWLINLFDIWSIGIWRLVAF